MSEDKPLNTKDLLSPDLPSPDSLSFLSSSSSSSSSTSSIEHVIPLYSEQTTSGENTSLLPYVSAKRPKISVIQPDLQQLLQIQENNKIK
jgi:hypothetical protein